MAIPKHEEIRIPALQLLKDRDNLRLKDFLEPLAKHFNLSDEEVSKIYLSGNGHIFYDRISWSLSYMNMAGILDKPKRGIFKINSKGAELLLKPESLNAYIDSVLEKREPTKKKKNTFEKIAVSILDEDTSDLTPQEKLYASFTNIRQSIYSEILTTILSKTATEFEKLVVLLLQKNGVWW